MAKVFHLKDKKDKSNKEEKKKSMLKDAAEYKALKNANDRIAWLYRQLSIVKQQIGN